MLVKYRVFYELFKTNLNSNVNVTINKCLELLKRKYHLNALCVSEVEHKLRGIRWRFKEKWLSSRRFEPRFLEKNKSWLDKKLFFPIEKKTGRPALPFLMKGRRARDFAVLNICKLVKNDSILLLHSALFAAKKSKNKNLYDSIKKLIDQNYSMKVPPLSTDESLAMVINSDLSMKNYEQIRAVINEKVNILPFYQKMEMSKKKCTPQSVRYSSSSASVSIQELVKHTVDRIILSHSKNFEKYLDRINNNLAALEIIFKYGFDGSSGQSQYNQSLDESSDASLFAATMTPLMIKSGNDILWKNDKPNSYRFTRPIRLEYVKETQAFNREMHDSLSKEVENLETTTHLLADGRAISVKSKFYLTAIDGKVSSDIHGVGYQCCSICQAKPNDMNDLDNFLSNDEKFPINNTALLNGISPLHSWIRTFDCLLHLAYRMKFKSWQARKESEKKSLKKTKLEIQKQFELEFNMRVDQPLANSGYYFLIS
jgi:hypothetical protein